jgi:tRNA modification GTPase
MSDHDPPTRPAAEPPCVVQLTPPGRGAIATLLVHGPGALDAVLVHCRNESGDRLTVQPGDRLRLVRFGPAPAEQIVLHAAAAERVELHCHGGQAVVSRIVELLAAQGCQTIDWRQWIDRQADRITADALQALAAAPTMRTAAILVDQYHGALAHALEAAERDLSAGRTAEARAGLEMLLGRAALGRHLVRPWRVVLAGPPNAGKSTLINALLGYARAIVHPTPGTTRDVVTATTAIDGWPVELVDTAGLHAAHEPLEQAGIALAERELAAADLVVLVFDRSQPPTAADAALVARYPQALVVQNKADLPAAHAPAVGTALSALSGQGIDELSAAISQTLVPDPPPAGAAVPFTEPQIARVQSLVEGNAECRNPNAE